MAPTLTELWSSVCAYVPVTGDSIWTLRWDEDKFWLIVALAPLRSVVLLCLAVLLGIWLRLGRTVTAELALGILALTVLLTALTTLALPVGIYKDLTYLHETTGNEWETRRPVFIGLGIAAILFPVLSDPVALSYLHFRWKQTDLGPSRLTSLLPGFSQSTK